MDQGVAHQDSPSMTSTERALLEVWSEVLETDRLGVHDNFFEMGGHSFLAIKVMSLVRQIYPVEISLLDFLDAPTISEQSSLIDRTLCSDAAVTA